MSNQLHPYVTLLHGQVKTTSLTVAEYFGKQHKDVLRAIQNLECSTEFNQRNFALVEYIDAKGEKRPSYEMTKNGFVFLVMGFTGSAAAKLKEAYILAFDQMESELLKIAQPKPLQISTFSPGNNPFDRVHSGLLKNLHDISKPLAEAYLITKGVTPELVADIQQNSSRFISQASEKIEKPKPLPLDVIVSRFVSDWFDGIAGAPFAPCLGSQMQSLFFSYRRNNKIRFPYGIDEFMAELYRHPSLYRQRVCIDKKADAHRVMVMINSLKPSNGKDFHVWINDCIIAMDEALKNYPYNDDITVTEDC